jgi:hypothetical protein
MPRLYGVTGPVKFVLKMGGHLALPNRNHLNPFIFTGSLLSVFSLLTEVVITSHTFDHFFRKLCHNSFVNC